MEVDLFGKLVSPVAIAIHNWSSWKFVDAFVDFWQQIESGWPGISLWYQFCTFFGENTKMDIFISFCVLGRSSSMAGK